MINYLEDKFRPSFQNSVRASIKTFAGVISLLCLSLLAERMIVFFGMQIFNIPIALVIFFIIIMIGVLLLNTRQHHEVYLDMLPNLKAWWHSHRIAPLTAVTADLYVVIFRILPTLLIFVLIFNWPLIPHIVCIGILINLLFICPKRKVKEPDVL
ncbi:MAG TPA: hypothetical protein PKA63_05320 [Oligoflexia bacterium]|nr:hypothetical protein [Oligoflexia bacterium]HMP48068.1 hypothetical protein [Oligoflexia bacterium]